MRIILISDSHGNKLGIDKIFSTQKFDYLFFMGDGINDLGDYIYLDNVFVVSGNCDWLSEYPIEREFDLNGVKFLITHGHKYFVKKSLAFLRERAYGENVDFVCFGHTHTPCVEKYMSTTLINPGSFHKNMSGKSYGKILKINNKNDFKIEDLIIE